jgi:aryl-alcohol dehydrogenase-like predicted oxidoreductase
MSRYNGIWQRMGLGADKEISKEVFDAYANAGGNFVDTANRYTEGTSEKWLGEFIHSDRDHFVLTTKYSLKDRNGDPNFAGNQRKNLMRSVEESLKRLDTDFIDLFWLHIWDGLTPTEEIMKGLDDLCKYVHSSHISIALSSFLDERMDNHTDCNRLLRTCFEILFGLSIQHNRNKC